MRGRALFALEADAQAGFCSVRRATGGFPAQDSRGLWERLLARSLLRLTAFLAPAKPKRISAALLWVTREETRAEASGGTEL